MCYVDEETKEHLTLRHAVFSEADEHGIRDLLEVIVDGVKYGRGGGTSVTTMYSQAALLRRCRHCNVKADKDEWILTAKEKPDFECLACDKYGQIFIPEGGIVTIEFGGKTHCYDGINFDGNIVEFFKGKRIENGIRILPREIIAWRPLPEPYKEEES